MNIQDLSDLIISQARSPKIMTLEPKTCICMEQEAQWLANSVINENGNLLEYRHLL